MKKLFRWAPLVCLATVLALTLVIAACSDGSSPTAPQPVTTTSVAVAPGLEKAASGTPDGQTPAVEQDCEGLSGPALGLCNSYCGAMDCDFATPNASAVACERVRARYIALTEQEPPCVVVDPGLLCGNGICNAGDGEDCVSCPTDCNGAQGGQPADRYCCGDGDGLSPVPCTDARCTEGPWECTG